MSLRKVGTRVRGQYYMTKFTGTVLHFETKGNGRGSNEVSVFVRFDETRDVELTPGKIMTDQTGCVVSGIPDAWSKSPSRKRGWDHVKAKDSEHWVEIVPE